MALTVTRTGYQPIGAARPVRGGFGFDVVMTMGEFVFDSAYATGGESLTAAQVGLADILFITFSPEPSGGTGGLLAGQSIIAQYDYTNSKVMALGATSGAAIPIVMAAEIANATDLSAFTVRFLALGHSLT